MLQRVHQVIADQNDAEELVRAFEQLGGDLRAGMSLVGEMAQPEGVQAHHGGFGAGEVSGKKDEQQDGDG